MVKHLFKKLLEKRAKFDNFWDTVMEEREAINKIVRINESIDKHPYYE